MRAEKPRITTWYLVLIHSLTTLKSSSKERTSERDVTVNVTFPENYQAEELQGKPTEFKVKIKEIKVKELPELDDDFAQDVFKLRYNS